ncbi:MAG: hypothetical protein KGI98_01875 [Euryarchaeota archaeon]|nr:hypothetical protein [Euryarchaeota archaeon]
MGSRSVPPCPRSERRGLRGLPYLLLSTFLLLLLLLSASAPLPAVHATPRPALASDASHLSASGAPNPLARAGHPWSPAIGRPPPGSTHGSSDAPHTGAPGWSALCNPCSPGAVVAGAMAYDPVDGYVVLFGGYNATAGAFSGTTWMYHAGAWTVLCTLCGPAPRSYASMTFDAADGVIVLFGGFNGAPLGDTWTFRGGSWTQRCSPCAPPARSAASLAYDAGDGLTVLFGGCGATCPLGDAWSYRGGTWSALCGGSCPVPARQNASMAYDPADREVVLFGGSSSGGDLSDGWTFRGGSWSALCVHCAPPARHGGSMAYDTSDGYLLLFGGYNASTSAYLFDTWEFLDGSFVSLTLAASPPARELGSVADDVSDGALLLFSGTNGAALSDAWGFHYGLSAAAPVPTPASVDVGQTVSFDSVVSGGSAPYAYTWSGLPTGCSSSNADPLSCTPTGITTNTTFPVRVFVSDTSGTVVESPRLNLTVHADPVEGGILPSPASGGADDGQNISFSAQVSGGSGGYSFAWSGLPTGCAGSNSKVVRCVPSGVAVNATFSVSVVATDSNGGSATSPLLSYLVDSLPTVATPWASAASVEVGSAVTFQSATWNGSGGYHWTWMGLPSGCTSSNAPVLACRPSGVPLNNTFPVQAAVRDTNGVWVVSSSFSLFVVAGPSVSVPRATPALIDLGQTVNLSVVAGGGVGNYVFQWLNLPSGCASADAPTISCRPTGVLTNSTYLISVNVTDGNGRYVVSGPLFLQVDADPFISSFSASAVALDAGQNTTFSVSVTGGAGGYGFTWAGLPTGCVGVNSVRLVCEPSPTLSVNSTFVVRVRATDSTGFVLTSGPLTLQVDIAPRLSAIWASPRSLDAGQNLSLLENVTGGSGGYILSWWGLPSGCGSADVLRIVCHPSGVSVNATDRVWATVRDSNGLLVQGPLVTVTVEAWPSVATPTASVSPQEVGGPLVISTEATLGSGSYAFHWSGLPAGCSAAVGPVVDCTPTQALQGMVEVYVVDGYGAVSASASVNLSIVQDPSIVSFFSSSAPTTVGNNISLTVVTAGGIAPFHYSFSGLPSGCESSDAARISCVPLATGTFDVEVVVTDAHGFTASSSLSLQVLHRPAAVGIFGLSGPYGYLLLGGVVAGIGVGLFVAIPMLRHRRPEEEAPEEREVTGGEEGGTESSEVELPVEEVSEGAELAPAQQSRPEELQAPSDDEFPTSSAVPSSTGVPLFPLALSTEAGLEPSGEPPAPPLEGPAAFGAAEVPVSLLPRPSVVEAPPEEEAAVSTGRPDAGAQERARAPPGVRHCPLCGSPLSEQSVCRSCELDWSKLQIEGRTDTLKRKRPRP